MECRYDTRVVSLPDTWHSGPYDEAGYSFNRYPCFFSSSQCITSIGRSVSGSLHAYPKAVPPGVLPGAELLSPSAELFPGRQQPQGDPKFPPNPHPVSGLVGYPGVAQFYGDDSSSMLLGEEISASMESLAICGLPNRSELPIQRQTTRGKEYNVNNPNLVESNPSKLHYSDEEGVATIYSCGGQYDETTATAKAYSYGREYSSPNLSAIIYPYDGKQMEPDPYPTSRPGDYDASLSRKMAEEYQDNSWYHKIIDKGPKAGREKMDSRWPIPNFRRYEDDVRTIEFQRE